VPALRSPSFREAVLWREEAPSPAGDTGPLPAEADVVVVGGGYCGMAAAWELARRGRSVVLLEAHALGWGASSRNGGMVIPELKPGPAALERTYGPLGLRLYAAVNEAFDFTEKVIAEHGIDCDYERTGQLYLAHHDRLLPHFRDLAHEHQALGEDVRFLDRISLASEIGSTLYPAGLVFERTGGLQPARFHAGLVTLARRAGALLHDNTRALELTRARAGYEIRTPRGRIRSAEVLLATNAYADEVSPRLRRGVLPVGSYIIATEPLDAGLADELSPHRRMFVDSKNFLFYWRVTPDGRMVFGGRRSLAASSIAQAADFLYESMLRIHPQLADTAITHAWGGNVAVTLDRLPHVGRNDGVLYATGCNGSGVALLTWLGTRLGAMVCSEAPPPFAELKHRAIPLLKGRDLYLPFVGLWFRWQDRGYPQRRGVRDRVAALTGRRRS
jgi:glycine/D-amino acid oxidase-like deaminating enzyme